MRVRYTNIVRKLVSHLGATHLAETLQVEVELIRRWSFDEEEIPEGVVRRLTAYREELRFVSDARKRRSGLFIIFED